MSQAPFVVVIICVGSGMVAVMCGVVVVVCVGSGGCDTVDVES